MNALIVLAHGSRREKSNQEVIDLVDSIRPGLGARFDIHGNSAKVKIDI